MITVTNSIVVGTYTVYGSFRGLLPRFFIDALVLKNMTVTTTSGELAARGAPEVALVTIHRTSQLSRAGCSGGGRWCQLFTTATENTSLTTNCIRSICTGQTTSNVDGHV